MASFLYPETLKKSIKFQGCLDGAWYDLNGVKLDDLNVYATITAAGAYIVAGIEGFEKIRANLTAITSGSVTAVGRLTRAVA